MTAILEIEKLSVSVGSQELTKDVSFSLEKGSCLGILGESGSGKSVTCKAIMGLLPSYFSITGRSRFLGKDLLGLSVAERRKLRGKEIGFIMQNPMTAFDPLGTIGAQMAETLTTHLHFHKKQALVESSATLETMRIRDPERVLRLYPHELSGGMLQRVMIGLTLRLEPQFIIADEPTTALDVITQYEVMKLFIDMKNELKTTMIFISHDLGVIAKVADNLLVMSQGEVVEKGEMKKMLLQPETEHARYLFSSRHAMMDIFHHKIGGLA